MNSDQQKRKFISLGYHDIVDERSSAVAGLRVAPGRYTLSRLEFQKHLEAIREVRKGSAPDFITFDDGGLGSLLCAAPELERLDWRGHFFITTDWIGRPGFLNRDQIRELRNRGHVIGSHTRSHPARMSCLKWNPLLAEWTSSCAVLSDLLKEQITTASVSDGYYSRTVGQAAAAAGLQILFNSEPTRNAAEVDGCLVLGRYPMLKDTTAEQAAALAAENFSAHLRQAALWRIKKLAKIAGGENYLALRKLLLARRGETTTAPVTKRGSTKS